MSGDARPGDQGGPASLRRLRAAVAGGATVGEALAGEPGAVLAADAARLGEMGRVELHGAGAVLQPLLDDAAVTDVLVNGDGNVWVDRGTGLQREERASRALRERGSARALATRLAASAGRRLDDARPVVDGTLPDGTRLHVVLPPLAPEGPLVSLRTRRRRAFQLSELVRLGTVTPPLAPVLRAMVARRANVLVSGATGSGKTTLLASLLALVPADERIVIIEEATELAPEHPHVVHLQTRGANVQHAGEVGLAELVRAAMRMRPDRLVLGECRGAEVRDVLGALNTGHEGGWATVHANTADDVPARLIALGALAGMGRDTVAAQACSAIDALVHVRRDGGRRYVAQVGLLSEDFRFVPAMEVCARSGAEGNGPGGSTEGGGEGGSVAAGSAEGDNAGGSGTGGVAADAATLPAHVLRTGPGWPEMAARLGLPESLDRIAAAPPSAATATTATAATQAGAS